MNTYNAISGDENFLSKLQEKQWGGEIHSTFNRTINISCFSGQLYTLASEELDNAPNTLRVAKFLDDVAYVPLKASVFIEKGKLIIEGVAVIELDNVRPWRPFQLIFPKKEEYPKLLQRVKQVNRWLSQVQTTGGYLLHQNQGTSYEKMVYTMLWKESTQLLIYLKQRQLFEARKQLTRIIGLGPGLTPSGDDFLVGLALIFTSIDYPYHSLKQWLINTRQEMKKRTNSISFSTLNWAIEGAARERIGLFLKELFNGDQEDVLKAKMQEVLAIGATSGGDMLTGMLAGIELTIQMMSSKKTVV